MKDKRGLGRGFASLLPQADSQQKTDSTKVMMCDVSKITPNKNQPRKSFNKETLLELSSSIKEKGILQPLLVRESEGGFALIAGGRRFEAAKMAGLKEVPVLVKDVTDSENLELALIENIQRENLNAIEEAGAYRLLIEEFELSHDEVAKRVGKNRSTITNFLRLLKLPKPIQDALLEDRISMGHARTILALDGEKEQLTLLKQILEGQLSVRKTEEVTKRVKNTGKSFKLDSKAQNPVLRSLIEELQQILGTKVKIVQQKNSKGRLIVEFFSTKDLNRILGLIRKQ